MPAPLVFSSPRCNRPPFPPSTSVTPVRSGGSADVKGKAGGTPVDQTPSRIDPMDQPPPPPSLFPHQSDPLTVSAETRAEQEGGAAGNGGPRLGRKLFPKKASHAGRGRELTCAWESAPEVCRLGFSFSALHEIVSRSPCLC